MNVVDVQHGGDRQRDFPAVLGQRPVAIAPGARADVVEAPVGREIGRRLRLAVGVQIVRGGADRVAEGAQLVRDEPAGDGFAQHQRGIEPVAGRVYRAVIDRHVDGDFGIARQKSGERRHDHGAPEPAWLAAALRHGRFGVRRILADPPAALVTGAAPAVSASRLTARLTPDADSPRCYAALVKLALRPTRTKTAISSRLSDGRVLRDIALPAPCGIARYHSGAAAIPRTGGSPDATREKPSPPSALAQMSPSCSPI